MNGNYMKNFALIGIAKYIASRHLKTNRVTGSRLATAMGPHDSAGSLDQFTIDNRFFTDDDGVDGHRPSNQRLPYRLCNKTIPLLNTLWGKNE